MAMTENKELVLKNLILFFENEIKLLRHALNHTFEVDGERNKPLTVELSNLIRTLNQIGERYSLDTYYSSDEQKGMLKALNLISLNEGWEDSRDKYAKKLNLPVIYKNKR